jgi:hypothetical protein
VLNKQSLPVAGGRLMDSSMRLTGGILPRSLGAFSVDHPEFVAIDQRVREVTLHASDNTQHFIDSGLIAEIVLTPLAESAGAQSPKTGTDGQKVRVSRSSSSRRSIW